ncbi:MAG: hypothetical protein EP338_04600 [Bacteroidetes bacterium]|nr:MAG: hypothetical protein EP338_04600 [Bacteroidota bacterium]
MKKTILFTGALTILLSAFMLTTTQWKVVDHENVSVNFELVDEGTTGSFTGVQTVFTFDAMHLENSSIEATVQANTVNTGNDGRDNHLKNEDFFDVEKYPTISFKSDRIEASEFGFVAIGKLSMKDQVHEVKVPFTFHEDAESGQATFKGEMEVYPYQFGVFRNKKAEKQLVRIQVEMKLNK